MHLLTGMQESIIDNYAPTPKEICLKYEHIESTLNSLWDLEGFLFIQVLPKEKQLCMKKSIDQ